MRIHFVASAVTTAALGVVALLWSHAPADALVTSTAHVVGLPGPSCPLTPAKQLKSTQAWAKMMPVLRSPRCSNCHGGIPDPIPEAGAPPKRHRGVVDIESSMGNVKDYCQNCHMKGWRMPGPIFHWPDKSDSEICSMMKKNFTGASFVDHIRRDGGGTQFIDMAFKGERGLDPSGQGIDLYEAETDKKFVAEPPPGTHAQLTQQAMAWIAAQGGSFVGDDKCGCEIAETGELYLLEIVIRNGVGYQGIVVSDSTTMRIRVNDTTVTVFSINNSPTTAEPQQVVQGESTINWIPDPLGLTNIVKAVGTLLVDYPVEGSRTLKVDFTQEGTRSPEFEILYRKTRSKSGGEAHMGFPLSSQFELIEGKKVYEIKVPSAVYRLTLINAAK